MLIPSFDIELCEVYSSTPIVSAIASPAEGRIFASVVEKRNDKRNSKPTLITISNSVLEDSKILIQKVDR